MPYEVADDVPEPEHEKDDLSEIACVPLPRATHGAAEQYASILSPGRF